MLQIQLVSVILIKARLHPSSVSNNHPKTARKEPALLGYQQKRPGLKFLKMRLEHSTPNYAQIAMHFTRMTLSMCRAPRTKTET